MKPLIWYNKKTDVDRGQELTSADAARLLFCLDSMIHEKEEAQRAPPAIPPEDLQRAGALYGLVKDLRLRLTNVQENTLERLFSNDLLYIFNFV